MIERGGDSVFHASTALVGGAVVHDVRITSQDGTIASVEPSAPVGAAVRLPGLVIPGLVDAHSHAFHRALRGRTWSSGDFWAWRRLMYRAAGSLDPDGYRELATLVYVEMALSGVTTVGEFHYLHHPPSGRYRDSNAMGEALFEAAAAAGVRITLLDTCYLRGGFDEPLQGAQERFGDRTAEAWAERVDGLRPGPNARVGAAVHSVRAVDGASATIVADWARRRDAPLHFHLSEQQAENEACLAATGMTPTAVLGAAGVLGPGATAIHATHLDAADVALLGDSNVTICACPTTERDLGDGIAPIPELIAAGCGLCVGSDSHAVIDLLEEARLVEQHERLRSGVRGAVDAAALLAAATTGGARSLGWHGGDIAVGMPADVVAVDVSSLRHAGIADSVASLVAASTAADVTHVVVGGSVIVADGEHRLVADPAARLDEVIRRLLD